MRRVEDILPERIASAETQEMRILEAVCPFSNKPCVVFVRGVVCPGRASVMPGTDEHFRVQTFEIECPADAVPDACDAYARLSGNESVRSACDSAVATLYRNHITIEPHRVRERLRALLGEHMRWVR